MNSTVMASCPDGTCKEPCLLTVKLVTPDNKQLYEKVHIAEIRNPQESWPYKKVPANVSENGENYVIRITTSAGLMGKAAEQGVETPAEYYGCFTPEKIVIDFPAVWLRRAAYHIPPQKSIYNDKSDAEKDFDQKKQAAEPKDQENFHFIKKYWYELEMPGTPGNPVPLTGIQLQKGENYVVIEMQPCLLRLEMGEAIRDKTRELWKATKTPYALPLDQIDAPRGSIQTARKNAEDRLKELTGKILAAGELGQKVEEAILKEAISLSTQFKEYDDAIEEAKKLCAYAGAGTKPGIGGDCSGTTWGSYKEAGVDYGKYMAIWEFNDKLKRNDPTFPFKEIIKDDVQPGDIYLEAIWVFMNLLI